MDSSGEVSHEKEKERDNVTKLGLQDECRLDWEGREVEEGR